MAAAEKNFVATKPLFVGAARAHNPGDLVPADNVERNGWQEGVAKEGTKEANALVKELAKAQGAPTDEDAAVGVPATPPVS